ncbi:MAG TPA: methyltransferase domain-containing protein [Acidimicrobiales bacterium]|nr:methyltransferase domain-containing protein [Acidimicrobiales bacterium]
MSTDLRPQLHGMWSSVADSWAQHANFVDIRGQLVTDWMIAATTPAQGDRALELACGPGAVTLAVAGLVDPAEVIASDVAVEMVDIAVARAHSGGLYNVHGRRLDLEGIEEPDAIFDLVYCRDGLQFALEPDRAAAEIARVTKPGGRVAVAVWAERDRNPWLGLVLDVLSEQLGMPVPPPGVPGPFSLGDATRLETMFPAAGFTDVRIEELSVPLHAPSFDGWWRMTTSLAGPLALIIGGLDADVAEKVRTRAYEAVGPYEAADGSIDIPGTQHVLTARR